MAQAEVGIDLDMRSHRSSAVAHRTLDQRRGADLDRRPVGNPLLLDGEALADIETGLAGLVRPPDIGEKVRVQMIVAVDQARYHEAAADIDRLRRRIRPRRAGIEVWRCGHP